MRRAGDFSLLCLSPASNPHLYSELVPEGTFQKQQACPVQTTQRHGSSMQFYFCRGQPFPETPPASGVTREGPAWQVRAAGQGAASSMGPGFLRARSHAGLPRSEEGREVHEPDQGQPRSPARRPLPLPEAPAPALLRAPESALGPIPRFPGQARGPGPR